MTEIAGEYVARALFSRNWQLREAALGFLGGMAQGGGLGDKRDAFRTLAKAVQVCVCGGGGEGIMGGQMSISSGLAPHFSRLHDPHLPTLPDFTLPSTHTPPSQRCMKDKVANVVLASLALFTLVSTLRTHPPLHSAA